VKLKEIKISRFKNQSDEWAIEGKPINNKFGQWLSFGDMNLIVGKNATGKSKTIYAIRHIADLFCGDVQISQLNSLGFGTTEYNLKFDSDGEEIQYYLDFKDGKIIQETLTVDDEEKLNRIKGLLWYDGTNGNLAFETDDDVLAVSKRDKKQHSFFETLYSWGKNLTYYRFGTPLGKDRLVNDINLVKYDSDEVDLKDSYEVTRIFIMGEKQFPDSFLNTILEDMKAISYDLQTIEVSSLKKFPVPAYGLNVKERDLEAITDQTEMSQGMFRALSLLVQLNYSLLSKTPSCILIDDIGEGLDYDRSNSLIELIIAKIKDSSVQVIMTTNDRFVMNKVPLEYWSVIQRLPKKSLFYNYRNSKSTFEEFQRTGLNNFDFLSYEYYIEDFEIEKQS